jgi:hypothetical protein
MAGPKEVIVRVNDVDGKPYGTYNIQFPCSGTCAVNTDCKATKI